MMESKIMWGIVCSHKECTGKISDVWCTRSELEKILKMPCPTCGSEVKQKVSFGYGKFRGSGFTRSTT